MHSNLASVFGFLHSGFSASDQKIAPFVKHTHKHSPPCRKPRKQIRYFPDKRDRCRWDAHSVGLKPTLRKSSFQPAVSGRAGVFSSWSARIAPPVSNCGLAMYEYRDAKTNREHSLPGDQNGRRCCTVSVVFLISTDVLVFVGRLYVRLHVSKRVS